jgi:hypothetical protein
LVCIFIDTFLSLRKLHKELSLKKIYRNILRCLLESKGMYYHSDEEYCGQDRIT